MPSDSRNSTMAKVTGLIFSLFDIASARKVPFAIPPYMQCILHGLTMAFLCVPFIFVHHEKCRLCGRHVIFEIFFYRDDNISYGELFFSYALITHNYNISRFNSWVAGAMGVKFLAQGNNSSRKPQLDIEPGTLQLLGRCPGSLLLPPLMMASICYGNRP